MNCRLECRIDAVSSSFPLERPLLAQLCGVLSVEDLTHLAGKTVRRERFL
jgi:hypothetical protein